MSYFLYLITNILYIFLYLLFCFFSLNIYLILMCQMLYTSIPTTTAITNNSSMLSLQPNSKISHPSFQKPSYHITTHYTIQLHLLPSPLAYYNLIPPFSKLSHTHDHQSLISFLFPLTHHNSCPLVCLIFHFLTPRCLELNFFTSTLNSLILGISSSIPIFITPFMLLFFLQIQTIFLLHPILSTTTITTIVKLHWPQIPNPILYTTSPWVLLCCFSLYPSFRCLSLCQELRPALEATLAPPVTLSLIHFPQ